MSNLIDELVALFDKMPSEKLQELNKTVQKVVTDKFIPNPGPQAECYNCQADQILYGGGAGGGKTFVMLGMALQKHRRSLLLRRLNVEVDGLVDDCERILGHKDGYNGQKHRWYMPEGRLIQFGGLQHPGDERKYKGQAKDFVAIDEASEVLESQVEYVINWLRSADPNQKCTLLLATNPPSQSTGEYLTRWFAPWVDPAHPLFPTPSGKLLYFVREGDRFEFFETEAEAYAYMDTMQKPPPRMPDGSWPRPLTRTFIRSMLADNPDYARTDYGARLAQMPEILRRRYMDGDFTAAGEDDDEQVIPTEWILAAQERWKETGGVMPHDLAMTALALDVAMGGGDSSVLSIRYGHWFAPLIVVPGVETPDFRHHAALVVRHRRDQCAVVIDCGGGWGGPVAVALEENNIRPIKHVGANASSSKTADKTLEFRNRRAESVWRLREALDPSQPGGSPICLPDDGPLRADLAAYRWTLGPSGILIEDKTEMKKRLGRSPDRGDAVVMCWADGQKAVRRGLIREGARASGYSDRPAFANVRRGPLTSRHRYGSRDDE
jgi:hypothetical protein